MPAYGVMLDDPEFYTAHPDTIPVLACFGISPEPNPYHIDVPDFAYTAGRIIADDLQKHCDKRYQQVSWLMQWLFSCSGNSSIDFDYEAMCEFQTLSWDQEEVAFAITIIEEAEGIMADALEGLAFLNSQPDLLQALQHNVQRIYKAIDRQKGRRIEPEIRLKWPQIHRFS